MGEREQMTVKELIELLQTFDDDLIVVRPIEGENEPVCSIDEIEKYGKDAVLIW